MGMSTHVVAFTAPDAKWKRMKKAYDACVEAGVEIPDPLSAFFNHVPPDSHGVEHEIEDTKLIVKKVDEDCQDGFLVDIKELLEIYPHVTHIKFYNSY